jgi:hypothetical protein
MVDVRPESMDLSLIGVPLRAFGAGSGALAGRVAALFYRYATRSGVEYVADAIVAPEGARYHANWVTNSVKYSDGAESCWS